MAPTSATARAATVRFPQAAPAHGRADLVASRAGVRDDRHRPVPRGAGRAWPRALFAVDRRHRPRLLPARGPARLRPLPDCRRILKPGTGADAAAYLLRGGLTDG